MGTGCKDFSPRVRPLEFRLHVFTFNHFQASYPVPPPILYPVFLHIGLRVIASLALRRIMNASSDSSRIHTGIFHLKA